MAGYPGHDEAVRIPARMDDAAATAISADCHRSAEVLRRVTIDDGIQQIGSYAFAGCDPLTGVTPPASIVRIYPYAFANSKGMLRFTATVVAGSCAFEFLSESCCQYLTVVIPAGAIAEDDQSVRNYSAVLSQIILPDGIAHIPGNAFSGLPTTEIILPESITSFGSSVFENCICLKEIIISKGVEATGNSLFAGCASLSSADLPADLNAPLMPRHRLRLPAGASAYPEGAIPRILSGDSPA